MNAIKIKSLSHKLFAVPSEKGIEIVTNTAGIGGILGWINCDGKITKNSTFDCPEEIWSEIESAYQIK